jgi:uncharacterized protein (DUF58 family)
MIRRLFQMPQGRAGSTSDHVGLKSKTRAGNGACSVMIFPFRSRKRTLEESPLSNDRGDSELFGPRFLDQLRSLSLSLSRSERGGLRGEHRSSARGLGMEFVDYRPYAPGDDLRLLDLAIYRRHRRLFVRQYEEQTESNVYIIVDGSASMSCPSPLKFRAALRLGAAIGYLGLVGFDRVTVIGVVGGELRRSRVFRGRARTLPLLRFLEGLRPEGAADFPKVLSELVRQTSQPGLALVLTDGYDTRGIVEVVDALRVRRHEVTLVQVVDDTYLEQLPLGEIELDDAETEQRHVRLVTEKVKRELSRKQHDARETLRLMALGRGTRSEVLPADLSLPNAVRRIIGRRRS